MVSEGAKGRTKGPKKGKKEETKGKEERNRRGATGGEVGGRGLEDIGERTAKKGGRAKGVRGFKGEITKEDGAEERRGRGFPSPSPLFSKDEKKWEGERERRKNDTGKWGERKGDKKGEGAKKGQNNKGKRGREKGQIKGDGRGRSKFANIETPNSPNICPPRFQDFGVPIFRVFGGNEVDA